MIVLMCGDRRWEDEKTIREVFDRLKITLLIEGGAPIPVRRTVLRVVL